MSNYESWRISYQSSEAAARSAWQEMIRLHHRVNELEAQLSAIGAGGVEPLRKQAAETSNDILTMADALIIQRTADARDAARYRWLRDNDWRNDEKMEPVIRLQLNAIWDEKIDAAMAAQANSMQPKHATKACNLSLQPIQPRPAIKKELRNDHTNHRSN